MVRILTFQCPFQDTECINTECRTGLKRPAPVKPDFLEDVDVTEASTEHLRQRMAHHLREVHNVGTDLYASAHPQITDDSLGEEPEPAAAGAANKDHVHHVPRRSRSPRRGPSTAASTSAVLSSGGGRSGDGNHTASNMVLDLGCMTPAELDELQKRIVIEQVRRVVAASSRPRPN